MEHILDRNYPAVLIIGGRGDRDYYLLTSRSQAEETMLNIVERALTSSYFHSLNSEYEKFMETYREEYTTLIPDAHKWVSQHTLKEVERHNERLNSRKSFLEKGLKEYNLVKETVEKRDLKNALWCLESVSQDRWDIADFLNEQL